MLLLLVTLKCYCTLVITYIPTDLITTFYFSFIWWYCCIFSWLQCGDIRRAHLFLHITSILVPASQKASHSTVVPKITVSQW